MLRIFLIFNILSNVLSYSLHSFPVMNMDRRNFVTLSTGFASGIILPNTDKPICVIGANGETGRECVKLLSDLNKPVKAVSRKEANTKWGDNIILDIRNDKKIDEVLRDVSSVIFLANAKKKYRYFKTDTEEFQNYEDIDVLALSNIVNSCIKYKIPRLVYVSASCRSCKDNDRLDIDKISGIECENCLTKQMGENLIKQTYFNSAPSGVDYTIVRIGYLINGENRGAKEIEINQDYTKSGMISRVDLANVCINSLNDPNTARTTFEAYYRDTTQPYDVKESLNRCTNLGKSVEECFFGSEYKNSKPKDLEEVRKKPIKGSLFTTGNEYQGDSWKELFSNLHKDKLASDNNDDEIMFGNV